MLSALLDHILGPRDWSVIMINGRTAWAVQHWADWSARPGEVLVRSNLRQGAAQRLALRLRQRREDTLEGVG